LFVAAERIREVEVRKLKFCAGGEGAAETSAVAVLVGEERRALEVKEEVGASFFLLLQYGSIH